MPYYTPLRYPGGKRRLAAFVMRLLESNRLKDVHYAEPYAGGSAVALALLFEEYASTIHINDLSRPVYAFWNSALNDTEDLCSRIKKARITMRQWYIQRAIYKRRDTADLSELGFAALFLNRVNRSGIIGGGVIGGKSQSGEWRLDVRFNRAELVHRIRKIARFKNRIVLHQLDALDFIDRVIPQLGKRTFLFFDPPYIEKGEDLYLNDYELADHQTLARRIAALEHPWIVTYDYAALRKNLYPACRRIIYDLHYMAQDRCLGREVLFLSHHLSVPPEWHTSRTIPMGRPHSANPLYGRMERMKPYPELETGSRAEKRFTDALKAVLSVPKTAVPNPFSKPRVKKKRARHKG
jgi:DNA adenine methylase